MFERRVQVGSASGLHARPAATFVRAATAQPHRINIRRPDGQAVDARSILSVLALHVGRGDEVILSTEEAAAVGALDELAALLARDLDQDS